MLIWWGKVSDELEKKFPFLGKQPGLAVKEQSIEDSANNSEKALRG